MINRMELVNKLIDEHDCSFSEEFVDFLFQKIEDEFLFSELCTYFYLKEEIKNCEAYDGYTKEDQLEFYITKQGFNPIEKLALQKNKIINTLSNYVTLDEIGEFEGDYNEAKIKLSNIENKINSFNLNNKDLISSFICDIYFKK